jgi:hypothetical protein
MQSGVIPPSPDHVADLLEKTFSKNLEPKYIKIMNKFYRVMKSITHRETKEISGKDFDEYYREAEMFVGRMRKIIENK